ncbi:polysaccharide biosynthesis protein [Ruminiclostridium hungatei]|uniref:Polysaccharide biosynthesis protein n=1 Tax=Ruminiclostridium hungatei TaxID=48256 RepID=A0A1V4SMW5_RUMHU|nr:oligosaccharide flippase family protein [Ruminiclostridium hungatei]OPX44826.1 polysaccharide biosynthesis protein [Ruminiclostridium hungatei]
MSREKTLAKNSVIYMTGTLSSKLLVFLLLPIYTAYLSTSEYGYYDVICTTVLMIVPIVSVQIYDGIYRFSLDSGDDRSVSDKYITNALFIIIIAVLMTVPLAIAANYFFKIEFFYLIYLQILATCIFNTWQMIARGLKKNMLFAVSGIIMTFLMLLLNILFIVVLHYSVRALILSNIVSMSAAFIYMEVKLRVFRQISVNYINMKTIKELIAYTIPLIPNTISWWILNLSNRYIIIYCLGNDYNGIFAVASKFPSILMTVNMIFNYAWQDTAIYEKNSSDRDQFYSKMLNYFLRLQLGVLLIIFPFVKLFSAIAIGKEFADAVNYVPYLLIGAFFQFFMTFFSSFYYVFKKTGHLLYTTLIASGINIVVTLLLVSSLKIYAACMANIVSSFIVVVIRYFYVNAKFKIRIKISLKSTGLYLPGMVLYCWLYYTGGIVVNIFALMAGIMVIGVLNKAAIMKFKNILMRRRAGFKPI